MLLQMTLCEKEPVTIEHCLRTGMRSEKCVIVKLLTQTKRAVKLLDDSLLGATTGPVVQY